VLAKHKALFTLVSKRRVKLGRDLAWLWREQSNFV
jgi:hypothetical protein